jgi:hypothetical protein
MKETRSVLRVGLGVRNRWRVREELAGDEVAELRSHTLGMGAIARGRLELRKIELAWQRTGGRRAHARLDRGKSLDQDHGPLAERASPKGRRCAVTTLADLD